MVTTGTLSLTNGGKLSTVARGNAGNIIINARDAITIDGGGSSFSSGALSFLISGGIAGKGGDIQLTTGSLSVTNGAVLNSSTSGQGNAGNITIDVRDRINVENSLIFSSVSSNAQGNGGDIRLRADRSSQAIAISDTDFVETSKLHVPIVEAQGLVKTADGQIALVAFAQESTPLTTPRRCVVSK